MTTIRTKLIAAALLGSSALMAPSVAMAATPAPKFISPDGHSVDLTSGLPWLQVEEGGIGSGPGRVSMQRIYAGGAGFVDNWTGGLYKVTSGGVTKANIQIAGISDTFTGSGSTWTSDKADGATLTVDPITSHWIYTARDGTRIEFDGDFSTGGGVVTSVNACPGADPETCQVPLSVTSPSGLKFRLGWLTVLKCENGVPPIDPSCITPINRFQRLASVTSSAGYDLAGTPSDLTKTFAYNPASQIVTETKSNDAYAFVKSNVSETGTSNGLNQLTAYAGKALTHDTKGNVTGFGTDSFGYTSENLLTSATIGGTATTLAYDPLQRLYETSSGAATSRFAYDGLNAIAEYDAAGALQRRWMFDPATNRPLVWYDGAGTAAANRRYLGADERGTIISVSDSSGAVLAINTYDEYGIPATTNLGRFGYTGQAWIPSAHFWYYKARVYHPVLGRFMQPDPIGYVDSPNLYTYVVGDPVNLVDPFGLDALSQPAVNLARQFFGNAINYGRVNLVFSSNLAPPGRDAITIGNTIYVSESGISNTLLLHELTHVWQYQNGLYTLFQMFSMHVLAFISGTDIYTILVITPESKFENYTLEQQAVIVQKCASGNAAACKLLTKSKYFKGGAAKPLSGSALIPLYPIEQLKGEKTGVVIVEQD